VLKVRGGSARLATSAVSRLFSFIEYNGAKNVHIWPERTLDFLFKPIASVKKITQCQMMRNAFLPYERMRMSLIFKHGAQEPIPGNEFRKAM